MPKGTWTIEKRPNSECERLKTGFNFQDGFMALDGVAPD